jgi:5-methyltetrahydrofolate--homocysteine methyltransferase
VSFGLPNRPALNNAMYTLAKKAGLSAAIANQAAIGETEDEAAFDVLMGRDPNCERWIERCRQNETAEVKPATGDGDLFSQLRQSVKRGLKDDSRAIAAQTLAAGAGAMEIVENAVIPALEEIGKGFESGKVFLPQLLMSADAAGAAFDAVRGALDKTPSAVRGRPIVIATVKGDIHDIGKNIVRALLENYGFDVIDLGRDVAPETVIEAARNANAMMIALSALMTTTVGAMAETVALAKASGLHCQTCVGGAVVTQDYADEIGADFYAKDAMRTVRFAESLIGGRG